MTTETIDYEASYREWLHAPHIFDLAKMQRGEVWIAVRDSVATDVVAIGLGDKRAICILADGTILDEGTPFHEHSAIWVRAGASKVLAECLRELFSLGRRMDSHLEMPGEALIYRNIRLAAQVEAKDMAIAALMKQVGDQKTRIAELEHEQRQARR